MTSLTLTPPQGDAREAPATLRTSLGRALRHLALDVMRLATDVLPAGGSRAIAIWMGAARFAISAQGPRSTQIIGRFKDVGETEARAHARRYLTTMFLDFRFARRVITGKERPETWTCEQRNVEIVRPLIETNRPYIVATGHFAREAHAFVYTRESIPHRLTTIMAPVKERDSREHYRQFLQGLTCIRPDLNFLCTGDSALKALIRALRTPGNAVIIAADAFVSADERASYVRPFLGAPRRFATGAARIARMAQCPIVVCTPQLKDDGAPVIIWRKVVAPPETRDDRGDLRVTDEIIDLLEQSIIERPSQYALRFWR